MKIITRGGKKVFKNEPHRVSSYTDVISKKLKN